ncbi:MAG: hypothetical protein ACOCVG_01900 [Verrucomicrobiota bacterium]
MSQDIDAIIDKLLERHGQTYAAEIGIDLEANTPAPLFQLLVASVMFSARIGADKAVEGARALFHDADWTTPEKLAEAGWEARVRVLNENGYARYDESTSRMLGDNCQIIQDEFDGDLRKLREQAEGDPDKASKLLQKFKGIGQVGADIFLREVQEVWTEFHPFMDDKSRQAAESLDLPTDAQELAQQCSQKDFARLVTALIRSDLADDQEAIKQAA